MSDVFIATEVSVIGKRMMTHGWNMLVGSPDVHTSTPRRTQTSLRISAVDTLLRSSRYATRLSSYIFLFMQISDYCLDVHLKHKQILVLVLWKEQTYLIRLKECHHLALLMKRSWKIWSWCSTRFNGNIYWILFSTCFLPQAWEFTCFSSPADQFGNSSRSDETLKCYNNGSGEGGGRGGRGWEVIWYSLLFIE